MSKYSSICKVIDITTAISHMMDSVAGKENMQEVISDLKDVAKDIRYGGRWDGDFETVAEALTDCSNADCVVCPYRGMKDRDSCKSILKREAAAAIRQMGKDAKDGREEIRKLKMELKKAEIKIQRHEMFMSNEAIEESRESARWQIEDMERENVPPERFPWEGEK